MSNQPINLGTPNNNDGDSLYVGGVKINANFSELYTALAGSSSAALKVSTGSAPSTSTTLSWSSAQQAFVPASANAIRTLGSVDVSALYITNSVGVAGGADSDFSSVANTLIAQIDGKGMLFKIGRAHV